MKKSRKPLIITIVVIVVVIVIAVAIFMLGGSSGGPLPNQEIAAGTPHVEVALTFNLQGGMASDQFAVWIEDLNGNYIRTLYATHFIATGGYRTRAETTPTWLAKSQVASMSEAQVDALTGATPESGNLAFIWDLKDDSGNTVSPGEYAFIVEGTLGWSNRVVYSGIIDTSGGSATVTADAEYFYVASDRGMAFGARSEALNSQSSENSMLGNVRATFNP